MANISLAVAASHAPGLIGMFDQAPEASRQMVTSAYGSLTRQIREAELDVLLMVANDHMANNRIREYPDFVVGMAPEHRGPAEFFKDWLGCGEYRIPGRPDIAEKVLNGLNRRGVPVSATRDNLNFYDNMIADVTYKGRKATVSVDGNYPMGDLVKIKAECPEGPLALCVRIPEWCESATLIVNSVRTKVGPGYYRFDRHYGVKPLEFMIWFNMPVVCHKPIGCEEDPASYNFFALTRGPLVLAADERIVGEEPVCEPVINEKGTVPYKRTSVGVRHNLALEIPTTDGKTLTLIDYASAGADWDNETKIAAWIRTK